MPFYFKLLICPARLFLFQKNILKSTHVSLVSAHLQFLSAASLVIPLHYIHYTLFIINTSIKHHFQLTIMLFLLRRAVKWTKCIK